MKPEWMQNMTFANKPEAIAHLERILLEALSGETPSPPVNPVQMTCMNVTSGRVHQVAGDLKRIIEEVTVSLDSAGDDHIGVIITAGNHRISLKSHHDSHRIEIMPHVAQDRSPATRSESLSVENVSEPGPSHQGSPHQGSSRQGPPRQSPTSPRPPGLSSGVPASDVPGEVPATQNGKS